MMAARLQGRANTFCRTLGLTQGAVCLGTQRDGAGGATLCATGEYIHPKAQGGLSKKDPGRDSTTSLLWTTTSTRNASLCVEVAPLATTEMALLSADKRLRLSNEPRFLRQTQIDYFFDTCLCAASRRTERTCK